MAKNKNISILCLQRQKWSLSERVEQHIVLTFQNYRLLWKLLQELDEEMDIIISNADNSEICPFIEFIWEQHHQLTFFIIVRLIQ